MKKPESMEIPGRVDQTLPGISIEKRGKKMKKRSISLLTLLYPGDFKKISGQMLNMYEAGKKSDPIFVHSVRM